MTGYTIGFDIGGTKCAVVLGRCEGANAPPRIVGKHVFQTKDFPAPKAAIERMVDLTRLLGEEYRIAPGQFLAGGISCGGPLHSATGRILSPPNLPGWDDVPIVDWISKALGLPVRLQNDANAGALAEWHWGAARGTDTAIFLTFGTGMGAGLIINGRLHEGKDDLAGEVGHWRMADEGPEGFGKRGSFEGFCSGGGMARLARQKVREAWASGKSVECCLDETELANLDVRALSQAARAGDRFAREIFDITAVQLGKGLSLLIDLLSAYPKNRAAR